MKGVTGPYSYITLKDTKSIVPDFETGQEHLAFDHVEEQEKKPELEETASIWVDRRNKDKIKRAIKLDFLLHEVEKNVLMNYAAVSDKEKDAMKEKRDQLGKRPLEITDKADPDVYAVTFYTFLIKEIDSEVAGLVYKSMIAFMLQIFMFSILFFKGIGDQGFLASVTLGSA